MTKELEERRQLATVHSVLTSHHGADKDWNSDAATKENTMEAGVEGELTPNPVVGRQIPAT